LVGTESSSLLVTELHYSFC